MPDCSTKRCSKCGENKPRTNEFFHRNCASKDGLYHRCKTCHSYRKPREILPEGTKRCTECKQILAATTEFFYADERTKQDGLYPCCKPCFLVRAKKWRDNNLEQARAISLAKYYANQDRYIDYGKRYRAENAERWAEKNRKWAAANPDKTRATTLRRIARKAGAEGTHSASDVLQLYEDQCGRCGYCGITLYSKYHVDHYHPLFLGGSDWPDNLTLACSLCNASKGHRLYGAWVKARGW
jgi:5-methylcytosine-specific restriction endonuclease McrA